MSRANNRRHRRFFSARRIVSTGVPTVVFKNRFSVIFASGPYVDVGDMITENIQFITIGRDL